MIYRLLSAVVLLASLPASSGETTVRVGVFGLLGPTELVVQPAPGTILIVDAGGVSITLEGAQAAHLRLRGDSIYCLGPRASVTAGRISASGRGGADAEMVLGVPGKIERRFQGRLEVTPRRGALQVVVAMDREVAVASAVAAESPPGAPVEALKAQAVVTRSYYAAAGPRHDEFDFCDTTHCQYLREPPALDDTAAKAARATRNLVLRYQGQTVGALFSASCGGRTRSLAEVGMDSAGYPYFPVECAYCREGAPRWEARLEAKDVARLLEADCSEQARLDVGRRLGWNTVPGNNYRVHREDETLVLEGRGRGHGIGLCQEGAAAMAGTGADFHEILQHYYPNTSVTPGEP